MIMSMRLIALALVAIAVLGCGASSTAGPAHEPPASLEPIPGTAHHRISLTQRAAERIGVQTVPVTAGDSRVAGTTLVPYSALLYDADGTTFVYVSPEPLVFTRHDVAVERIETDTAILSAGPPVGAAVVSVGGAELLGTESEIGH